MFLVILVAAASLFTSNYFLRDIDDPARNAQDEIEAAYRDSSYAWEAAYHSRASSSDAGHSHPGGDSSKIADQSRAP